MDNSHLMAYCLLMLVLFPVWIVFTSFFAYSSFSWDHYVLFVYKK